MQHAGELGGDEVGNVGSDAVIVREDVVVYRPERYPGKVSKVDIKGEAGGKFVD
jgi:hypothetical protein